MIDALDHLTLRASFRERAVGAYETLLGRQAESGRLRVGNVGMVIEDHASTAQLSSMVFATASLDKAARLLKRRTVPAERNGDRLLLPTLATHQVPIARAGAATVAVRPEAITVETAPGPAGSLPGTLAKASYLGTHMEYSIETEAGMLFATCPKVERPLAAGDRVALVLAPRGVIVVEDQAV